LTKSSVKRYIKLMHSLIKSMARTLVLYCLLESAIFFAFSRIWLFPVNFLLFFFAVQLIFCLAVFLFLVKNKHHFINVQTGEQETVVNAANKITLFRITMLPFLFFLTLVSENPGYAINVGPVLAIAFALTFISDFLDGRVAKAKNLESYIGKILDSASDYLLLGVCAVAFFYFKLLKPWLFTVIIIRLLLNAVVMLILFSVHKKLRPQTTPLGKTAIAVIMILLVVEAAKPLGLPQWVEYVEPTAAIIIGVSMIDKVLYLIKGLRAKPEDTD